MKQTFLILAVICFGMVAPLYAQQDSKDSNLGRTTVTGADERAEASREARNKPKTFTVKGEVLFSRVHWNSVGCSVYTVTIVRVGNKTRVFRYAGESRAVDLSSWVGHTVQFTFKETNRTISFQVLDGSCVDSGEKLLNLKEGWLIN